MSSPQRGVALVLVLWVLVLLSVIAAAMSMTQRSGVAMVSNLRQEREARALLDAGLHFMMLQLENRNRPVEENPWPVDGRLHPWGFGGATLWVGAETENARIDLNQADEQLLARLLQQLGLEEETAWQVRDAILDWRDGDDVHRANGAEKDDYRRAGRPLGPRNGPFLTLEELRQVMGVTPELYSKLVPLLTVDARQRTVNPAFASRTVLSAIPGMTPDLVEQYLLDRQIALEQGQTPPLPPAGGNYFGRRGANASIYRVFAEVDTPSGMKLRAEAVVNTRSRTPRGYRILRREYGKGGERSRVQPQEENG